MRFRPDSILFRIVWLHIIALAVAAVAVPIASYLLLSSTADSFENQTLRAHATQLVRYLHPEPGGFRLDLPGDLKTFYARGFDGFAFTIVDDKGRVITSSRPHVVLAAGSQVNSPSYFQKKELRSVYYGASIPEYVGGQRVTVEIAQDLEHPDVILDDVVADFLPRVLWFTIPIMLLVLAADALVVRRALRPVLFASERASSIDPARLDLRVPSERLPAEIRPLVLAFNQVLDRLQRAFRVQREFMADAGHELRTPLSVLRARIESMPDEQLAELMRHDISVMTRIVDQLFQVAELENSTVDFTEVLDLRSVCMRVVEHLSPVAERERKAIALSGAARPVLVRGDSALLFQAFRNLAENAVRHTPPGSVAELSVEESAIVRVQDEGPGIPDNEHELIFRRFWRRDRSRSDGAGLGLPIADRIIRAHGGRIRVENRKPTGAAFTVVLQKFAVD